MGINSRLPLRPCSLPTAFSHFCRGRTQCQCWTHSLLRHLPVLLSTSVPASRSCEPAGLLPTATLACFTERPGPAASAPHLETSGAVLQGLLQRAALVRISRGLRHLRCTGMEGASRNPSLSRVTWQAILVACAELVRQKGGGTEMGTRGSEQEHHEQQRSGRNHLAEVVGQDVRDGLRLQGLLQGVFEVALQLPNRIRQHLLRCSAARHMWQTGM